MIFFFCLLSLFTCINLLFVKINKLIKKKKKKKITFGNFKHSYNQRAFTIFLHRQSSCCPVQFLLEYLARRGNRPGPLFLNLDNNPVSRNFFADLLSLSLKACGLDSKRYKGHSFRIGAASFAADRGMSDAQKRALGRWKSNAFLKILEFRHFQHNFSFACNSCIACGGGCAWVT